MTRERASSWTVPRPRLRVRRGWQVHLPLVLRVALQPSLLRSVDHILVLTLVSYLIALAPRVGESTLFIVLPTNKPLTLYCKIVHPKVTLGTPQILLQPASPKIIIQDKSYLLLWSTLHLSIPWHRTWHMTILTKCWTNVWGGSVKAVVWLSTILPTPMPWLVSRRNSHHGQLMLDQQSVQWMTYFWVWELAKLIFPLAHAFSCASWNSFPIGGAEEAYVSQVNKSIFKVSKE